MGNVFRLKGVQGVVEIEIGDRDVLVIEVDAALTDESRDRIRNEWERLVAQHRVIILDAGMRAKVLRGVRPATGVT